MHRGLSFIKMEGLGNDFIVIDLRTVAAPDWLDDSAAIRRLCDRHRGIGADGILAVLPPRPGVLAAARMRVLNADGSEAEMCGNGLRCVAKYLFEQSRATPVFDVETGAGILRCEIHPGPGGTRETNDEIDIDIALRAERGDLALERLEADVARQHRRGPTERHEGCGQHG